jgi:hypothetical protein
MRLLWRTMLLSIAASVLSSAGRTLSAQGLEACKLISATEAADALGKPAIAKAQVIAPEKDTCGYMGAPFDVHTEALANPTRWSAALKEEIKKGKAEAIPGVGDDAAYMKDGNGDNIATARKGKHLVTISVYQNQGTAAQVKPLAIKLLKLALTKVP